MQVPRRRDSVMRHSVSVSSRGVVASSTSCSFISRVLRSSLSQVTAGHKICPLPLKKWARLRRATMVNDPPPSFHL